MNEYANMRAVERSLGDEERQTYTSAQELGDNLAERFAYLDLL